MSPRLAVAAILAAMVIYGLNFAVTRYGTTHGLTPSDLAAFRFLVAGPVMLPIFARRGLLTCAGIGWPKGIALAVTSGALMTLAMNTGLSYAPAAHGAALGPGTVTAIGVVYGVLVSRTAPSLWTIAGLAAIGAGLGTVALSASTAGAPTVLLGDAFFVLTGLLWGFYPILVHRWRVEPTVGAAIVSVLSTAYLPFWLAGGVSHLAQVPLSLLVFQAVFQGLLNVVLGLWLWGHAVKTLGAARTQLFPPLIPVLGTLFAIPVLGEVPGPIQAGGLALVVGGIVAVLLGARAKARAEAS